ncbi:hypothetical protein Tco_0343369 [Tanacetum coccineum]
MVPRTVLTRSGLILVNVVRPVNNVQSRTAVNNAGPMKNVINNAYSTARRPFNKIIVANNSNFTKKVNTVKGTRVNTARPKAVLSVGKGNKGNVVKASACRSKAIHSKIVDPNLVDPNPRSILYLVKSMLPWINLALIPLVDPNPRSILYLVKRNISYIIDYEEIDGGFVAFGGNSKGGKITRKGKIRTSKLDFEDVYFIKELKFNLLCVSQMCDKKNIFLEMNMYSIDLKNVVPQGGLTCLFAKATPDESNLWHMRLGHAEAVNTACYVQNRVLVIKPHNKTPYELFLGRKPALSFMRPFGCLVTILNTIDHLGTKACDDAGKTKMEIVPGKDCILLPLWTQDPPLFFSLKDSPDVEFKPSGEEEKKDAEDPRDEDCEVPSTEEPRVNQEKDASVNSTNTINTVSTTVNTACIEDNAVDENIVYGCHDDPNMLELEEIVYSDNDEDVGAEADINNLDTHILPSSISQPNRIHKDHPVEQIIGDIYSATTKPEG